MVRLGVGHLAVDLAAGRICLAIRSFDQLRQRFAASPMICATSSQGIWPVSQ